MKRTANLVMKWARYTLLVLYSLGCGIASAANNDESHTVAVRFVIRSLGSDIGRVSAKTVGTDRDNDFRDDVTVSVHFWFFEFSHTSSETANIRSGKLVSYHKTIDTKGQRKEISGELNGDSFTITVRDKGKAEHKQFPATGYVTTNLEFPELTLVPGEVRRLRVLDLENAEIVGREYRHIADEQTEINGRATRVIVTDFADKNSEGRRWTAIISGLPFVIRQEGKEKTGLFNPSYAVRQTRVTVDKE